MTAVSKHFHVDKLGEEVDDYNNTYHRTTKTKPTDIITSTYIHFNVENNDNYPNFKVGDQVRISKCKMFFK